MSSYLVVVCLAILFVAALTKATLGFGESLLAIPSLTLFLGVQVAAPLVSLVAASVTLMMIVKSWREIELRTTWRLVLAAILGVPVGVWGLKLLPAAWVTAALGILVILVGLYYLVRPTIAGLKGAHWTYLFGFLSGLLGGAYNMASPPMIVYGASRRWSPEQFRVTLQSFFLPISAMILVSHASAGLWTKQVLHLYLISLPVMSIAFWLGNRLSQRIEARSFERLVYVALIVLGIMLLV
jgi:uncharacterized membrane protein YfcA